MREHGLVCAAQPDRHTGTAAQRQTIPSDSQRYTIHTCSSAPYAAHAAALRRHCGGTATSLGQGRGSRRCNAAPLFIRPIPAAAGQQGAHFDFGPTFSPQTDSAERDPSPSGRYYSTAHRPRGLYDRRIRMPVDRQTDSGCLTAVRTGCPWDPSAANAAKCPRHGHSVMDAMMLSAGRVLQLRYPRRTARVRVHRVELLLQQSHLGLIPAPYSVRHCDPATVHRIVPRCCTLNRTRVIASSASPVRSASVFGLTAMPPHGHAAHAMPPHGHAAHCSL